MLNLRKLLRKKELIQMLIFTNCLVGISDEGCVKTAENLIRRIKSKDKNVKVVSFERSSELTDLFIKTNKLLLSQDTIKLFRKLKDKVLYIPFPAKPISNAVRIIILTLLCRRRINVLFSQTTDIDFLSRFLLKISRARFLVLSEKTKKKFSRFLDESRLIALKTGVDTQKFSPISTEKARELKIKYGFNPDKPIVLHVGHMQKGRNIAELMKISSDKQVLLVTSTLTANEADEELKSTLLKCENIKIISDYIPEIEEIFQLSDVYFFPVVEEGSCIDVPLSCLEAAACNKPVVTTDFGEMKAFKGKNGFYFIDSFEEDTINSLIDKALSAENVSTRSEVSGYDWSKSIDLIINYI